MLALTVPFGTKLHIGDGFLIVSEAKENAVRVALKFPETVKIERDKVRKKRMAIEKAARRLH